MSTGTPPTEFEFSPLSITPPGTLVTERPAEKDRSMLEQQAGIQAKTAAEPRKSSNAGLYVDGDTSNRVRVFSTVDLTPGTLVTERPAEKDHLMLEQQAGIQAKTAADPRKSSNAGPYVNGDTPNRVRVFAAVDLLLGTLVTERPAEKDLMMLE
jgi:hypothetical protein